MSVVIPDRVLEASGLSEEEFLQEVCADAISAEENQHRHSQQSSRNELDPIFNT